MYMPYTHYLQMTTQEWEQYQIDLSSKLIDYDNFGEYPVKYVGGLDISFDKTNNRNGCAYLTVMNYQTKEIVYERYDICEMDIPYVSGFLGFREIPQYKRLIDKIRGKEFFPDVFLVDGFGILHHRMCGSATQLGIELDIATIGVGKTLLCHDGLSEYAIKPHFRNVCTKKGDYVELRGNSGKIWGAAVMPTDKSSNPIYVTIGHKISLSTAIEIVNNMCVYKIPEPIRNSDIKSYAIINNI